MSTRGFNDQVLALSSRMDASKAKKEAPEIKAELSLPWQTQTKLMPLRYKVSFCGVKHAHLCCSIDIQELIYKFHFKCQYFFVDMLSAFG